MDPPPAKPLLFAVDDEPLNLELVSRTLRADSLRADYTVVTFSDPREALAAARKMKPDIILTDFRMPGLTGVELARTVRQERLPCACIVVTAFADVPEVLLAQEQKWVDGVVGKPWRPAEFTTQVALTVAVHRMRAGLTALERGSD
jgi:CheY-like chemotaxis protein